MAYEPCQGVIIGIMPQHVLSKNVLRLDAIFFPEAENITTVP
ncbi:nucleocapsid protein [Escherichia coli]|nr:nucleocapsid protein [Escherichia coli]EEZ0152124.1 nucleocapsid protein [Escherichia coli]